MKIDSEVLNIDKFLQDFYEFLRCKGLWFSMEEVKELVHLYVFPQVWGNSCLGFDVIENGKPAVGLDAITMAYTVVLVDFTHNIGMVYMNGKLCYSVVNINETFVNDIVSMNMKPRSQAWKEYD